VLLTSAEELGLAGARAWVRGRPAAVALNCDGVDDAGTLTCMYSGRAPAGLLDALRQVAGDAGDAVRVRRLLPGILVDGVALADAGWAVITVSRGTLRTLARIHTSADVESRFARDRDRGGRRAARPARPRGGLTWTARGSTRCRRAASTRTAWAGARSWRRPGRWGSGGAVVRAVRADGLAALVSDVPDGERVDAGLPSRASLLAHEFVTAAAMRRHTVVPVAYGTVFRSDADVRQLLLDVGPTVEGVLSAVADRVQVGVKLVLRTAAGAVPAHEAVAELYAALRDVAVAARARRPIGERMLANASFCWSARSCRCWSSAWTRCVPAAPTPWSTASARSPPPTISCACGSASSASPTGPPAARVLDRPRTAT
jgi:hypothetical protein